MVRKVSFWVSVILFCTFEAMSQMVTNSCETDSECFSFGGEFAECKNSACTCQEFFVLSNFEDKCIKVSSYGGKCEEDVQCQGFLGNEAKCNKTGSSTPGTCICYSMMPEDMLVHQGGTCYVVKELEESCLEDNQCILKHHGPKNELAKCVDKVCSCYNNPDISLASENVDGMCVAQVGSSAVDISVLAITSCGSIALLLFIYIMFRIAKKNEPKDIMRVFKSNKRSDLTTVTSHNNSN